MYGSGCIHKNRGGEVALLRHLVMLIPCPRCPSIHRRPGTGPVSRPPVPWKFPGRSTGWYADNESAGYHFSTAGAMILPVIWRAPSRNKADRNTTVLRQEKPTHFAAASRQEIGKRAPLPWGLDSEIPKRQSYRKSPFPPPTAAKCPTPILQHARPGGSPAISSPGSAHGLKNAAECFPSHSCRLKTKLTSPQ